MVCHGDPQLDSAVQANVCIALLLATVHGVHMQLLTSQVPAQHGTAAATTHICQTAADVATARFDMPGRAPLCVAPFCLTHAHTQAPVSFPCAQSFHTKLF